MFIRGLNADRKDDDRTSTETIARSAITKQMS